MEKQIRILAIIHIVFSSVLLLLLIGLAVWPEMIKQENFFPDLSGTKNFVEYFVLLIFFFIVLGIFLAFLSVAQIASVILIVCLAIPMLIGAIGLLYDKNWSRIVLKIYSWILIFLIPILGTALGIYSLLIFRKENLLLAEPQNS